MITEAEIRIGVKRLAARFYAVRVAADHFALVDNASVRAKITWLRNHRKDLWSDVLAKAVAVSWKRVYPEGALLRVAAKESVNHVRRGR